LYQTEIKQELINHLFEYITENKRKKIEEISAFRTRYLTLVLEDIEESKDASAVIRTCDCFGIQEINIVENNSRYRINPDVTMGSSKWIDINQFKSPKLPEKPTDNTSICLDFLKTKNYKIIAMTPNPAAISLEELPVDHKIALMFGSEEKGLSEMALKKADFRVRIPSYGFSESYTISVSAAISINFLMAKILNSGIPIFLTETELIDLKLKWIKKVIKKAEMLEKKFFERKMDIHF
jgi:tRNA (guanosine-2'-O-)-methyltransferase